MRALVDSVIARLAAHDVAGYWLEVPDKPTWPYVVLWSTAGKLKREAYGARADHLADRLGVTCVSQSALGVLDHAANVRSILDGWTPAATAWDMAPLALWDSQQAQPDLAVKLPVTGRHPYYAVDLYELRGEPKEA